MEYINIQCRDLDAGTVFNFQMEIRYGNAWILMHMCDLVNHLQLNQA